MVPTGQPHRCGVGVGQAEDLGKQQSFPLVRGEVGDHRGHLGELFESARMTVTVQQRARLYDRLS
uniref:Uncharacterized protein n=1 Tax=Mycobacterium riyadhense TaxID=486698 RepID=A0A653EDQ6_9MYCO|nr:hypothetical protein BIN_B_01079 [Mycobacterium riyadhense]